MKKNTKIILSGVSVLAVIGGGYVLYKFIEKQNRLKKIRKATKEREEQEASLPPEQQESADNYDPTSHVKQIKDMVCGWNMWNYTKQVNAIIIPLSDERTRKLAKAYKCGGKGLYTNLMGEMGAGIYTDSEAKLKRLGLTS